MGERRRMGGEVVECCEAVVEDVLERLVGGLSEEGW